TKLGIVCIASRIGRIIFDIILLNDIHTPIGIPIINEIPTAANIIAIIVIISPHKPNYPIKKINITKIKHKKINRKNKTTAKKKNAKTNQAQKQLIKTPTKASRLKSHQLH